MTFIFIILCRKYDSSQDIELDDEEYITSGNVKMVSIFFLKDCFNFKLKIKILYIFLRKSIGQKLILTTLAKKIKMLTVVICKN